MDRLKEQGHQVKVTDVKRCSFCTLQENIQYVADLFRASKKQTTVQAKLSCCYCSGSTCQLFLRYKREIFILGVLGFLKMTRSFPKIPEEVRSVPKSAEGEVIESQS